MTSQEKREAVIISRISYLKNPYLVAWNWFNLHHNRCSVDVWHWPVETFGSTNWIFKMTRQNIFTSKCIAKWNFNMEFLFISSISWVYCIRITWFIPCWPISICIKMICTMKFLRKNEDKKTTEWVFSLV